VVTNETLFCLMGSVILIKPDHNSIEPRFLSVLLRFPSLKSTLFKTSGSSAQQAIYLKDLKSMSCVVPPISMQREFAQRVKAMEKLKGTQRESLAQMDALSLPRFSTVPFAENYETCLSPPLPSEIIGRFSDRIRGK
jgi:type I restriction enzyme, S subunit